MAAFSVFGLIQGLSQVLQDHPVQAVCRIFSHDFQTSLKLKQALEQAQVIEVCWYSPKSSLAFPRLRIHVPDSPKKNIYCKG